jgi:hypothetical protein
MTTLSNLVAETPEGVDRVSSLEHSLQGVQSTQVIREA